MTTPRILALTLVLLACSCASDRGGANPLDLPPEPPPTVADAEVPDAPTAAADGCSPPVGPPPRTIAEVVALVNTLPRPVTIPCVLDALPDPLEVHAANSILSAQPADGARSPRIFVFLGELILSVVPDGMGGHLLEFGERRSETHTLKAELEFPIDHELEPTAPYERLPFDERHSSCAFCHAEEEVVPELGHPFARISRAIRPMTSQRVALPFLRNEAALCDEEAEPERCAMLKSLFRAQRSVLDRDFPTEWKPFF